MLQDGTGRAGAAREGREEAKTLVRISQGLGRGCQPRVWGSGAAGPCTLSPPRMLWGSQEPPQQAGVRQCKKTLLGDPGTEQQHQHSSPACPDFSWEHRDSQEVLASRDGTELSSPQRS